jgi:hypothetical protein
MAFQTVFKRYELKYMLTLEQKEKILEAMSPYMELDKYGRTTIRNIYFDTDNYRLIRRSIEKPAYKEKLRIRSYAQATADSTVFVELKCSGGIPLWMVEVLSRERNGNLEIMVSKQENRVAEL